MDIAKYWKTIVDTFRDGLLVVDPYGNIQAANPAAERITGYSEQELIGRSCRMLNCTGCKVIGLGPAEKWCPLFSKGGIKDKKCLITHKDRRTVHVLKTATVLRDDLGKIIGAVETLKDVTDSVRHQQEIESLKKTFQLEDGFHGIIGKSIIMENLFELIESVAQSDTPVIIQGESGTGKELVARAIHEVSPRKERPFVKVNCASLNENVLESELFGHIKGAYTGADRDRIGRFEAAHEGSIFLDEIGDLPLPIQVKLLRVLEEKKIERVGENKPVNINVRIITATHKNLETLIREGSFREDLFFRINVFPLYCPPLVDRREDIPLIAQSFIRQNAIKTAKKILGLTPEAMDRLISYAWPGNIRELRNAIEFAFVLCSSGAIDVKHLPPKLVQSAQASGIVKVNLPVEDSLQREELVKILKEVHGNQSEAAKKLGVSRVTVWKRMKKYGLRREIEF
ncbi:MAG: sigma 54-interacting transcriptional regulator [Proteobacteria bacterium]|nr:sigma 54-interacting transcriptional regulator [Pseudomonadota bacterium]MBU4469677.1 sigma 54-interacting transcriptional regulator [Pseudomonadota bacterium]MCG2751760.1 sigma 54-interacting transcriptional regulator [Desulfobacteraceae bacterium]